MIYVNKIVNLGKNIFRVLFGISIFYFTVIGIVYYMYGEAATINLMIFLKNLILNIFNWRGHLW